MVAGFGAEINALFVDAVATLFDSQCSVYRDGAPVATGRFQYTQSSTAVHTNVPCLLQHNADNSGSRSVMYANRLAGRVLCLIFVPRTYTIYDYDTIKVEGGDTYEVIGVPHLDGPDDPCLTIPAAAVTPVTTNPVVP